MKKPIKEICGNCLLFDGKNSTCSVRLLVAGQVFRNIPVNSSDNCLWEELGVAEHIKQTRFRVVDPETGEPSKEGRVIMEYDENFFGKQIGD